MLPYVYFIHPSSCNALIPKRKCEVAQSCPTRHDPIDCSPPGSSALGILQAKILEWVAISFSRDLPNPGIKPESPALAGGFFTTEPPGKPKCLTLNNY